MDLRFVREFFTYWLTRGKTETVHMGIRLSLRKASKRVRYYLLNGYEREDVELCDALLVPGDRVLEVGSAIGFVALYCMKQLGIADYAMVEANPDLLDVLEENFRLNGLPPPHVLNIAVGPQDGQATFNISRDYFASSLNGKNVIVGSITVDQRTIPSILAGLPFTPNVLIMDIEGAEIDIPVAHFALFDKIIVEFHERFVGPEPVRKLVDGLLALGFEPGGTIGYSSAFVRKSGQASLAA